MDDEPKLLDEETIAKATKAALDQIKLDIKPSFRAAGTACPECHLKSRAMRTRSRPTVLAEKFSQLLNRQVDPDTVRALAKLRGRVAHRPTEVDIELDRSAEQLLFDVVWEVLKKNLGLQPS